MTNHRLRDKTHQIKKWYFGGLLHHARTELSPSKPVLRFGGIFCGRKPTPFCRPLKRTFTYIVSWINEDSLLKKSSFVQGTLLPSNQMSNIYKIEV